jgi:hypothetical protein
MSGIAHAMHSLGIKSTLQLFVQVMDLCDVRETSILLLCRHDLDGFSQLFVAGLVLAKNLHHFIFDDFLDGAQVDRSFFLGVLESCCLPRRTVCGLD